MRKFISTMKTVFNDYHKKYLHRNSSIHRASYRDANKTAFCTVFQIQNSFEEINRLTH